MSIYGWKTEDEARKHVKVYERARGLRRAAQRQGQRRRGGGHRDAAALACPGRRQGDAQGQACDDGKADGPFRSRMQGNGARRQGNQQDPRRRPSTQLQHPLRQRPVADPPRHDRRRPPYPRPVEPQQSSRTRQLATCHSRPTISSRSRKSRDSNISIARSPSFGKIVEAKDSSVADHEHAEKLIAQINAQIADKTVDAAKYGYQELTLANGKRRSPLEELIRWRLWNRTGAGLMAELGSHQLDAAGILITAALEAHSNGKPRHARPLTVTGIGGRSLFPSDRQCEDHVYCIFEYPGPEYDKDPEQENRRHLFLDQRQRFRPLRRNRHGHQGNARARAGANRDALQVGRDRHEDQSRQGEGQERRARHGRERRRRRAGRQGRARTRPDQPRLYGGTRALGLVHQKSRPGKHASRQSDGCVGRCRDRARPATR